MIRSVCKEAQDKKSPSTPGIELRFFGLKLCSPLGTMICIECTGKACYIHQLTHKPH